MELDWEAMERDYLSGNGSYQWIADKYQVPSSQVRKRGRERGWAEKRKQKKQMPKANRKDRVRSVADQLLGMIELAVEETERQLHVNLNTGKTEDGGKGKGKNTSLLDMGEIKQLTAALKEILLLPNEEESEENSGLTVILEGDLERYAK